MKHIFTIFFLSLVASNINAQCANEANVHRYDFEGHTYEIVSENKTWQGALTCANERGGYLAELTSDAENTQVQDQASTAMLTFSSTSASNGFPYLWIGGNDINTEGTWVWEDSGTQFWMGGTSGSAIDYQRWTWLPPSLSNLTSPAGGASENALGFSLSSVPGLSIAATFWDDLDEDESLYYVIEYNEILATKESLIQNQNVTLTPNPAKNIVRIQAKIKVSSVVIVDNSGKNILSFNRIKQNSIDVSSLQQGVYIANITLENGTTIHKKLIKK